MKYLIMLALRTACDEHGYLVLEGPKGDAGIQGERGEAGNDGQDGADGQDGISCSVIPVVANIVAPDGGALVTCGETSSLILNGAKGDTGSTGATGATGQAGTPGTLVTPIQFCSGTGSYPSHFPEVGFCINDKIYAVYSANGGFLTEVAPGTWSSNGINNSCTFTVSPHCVVSH